MRGFNFTIADAQVHARKHNYVLDVQIAGKTAPQNTVAVIDKAERRGKMNKTEQNFERTYLIPALQSGDIQGYKFEGMTIRWGERKGKAMRYTADFVVWKLASLDAVMRVKLIEIKGGHIWTKDQVRYRGCAAEWKDVFDFEMWQKVNGVWRQLD